MYDKLPLKCGLFVDDLYKVNSHFFRCMNGDYYLFEEEEEEDETCWRAFNLFLDDA